MPVNCIHTYNATHYETGFRLLTSTGCNRMLPSLGEWGFSNKAHWSTLSICKSAQDNKLAVTYLQKAQDKIALFLVNCQISNKH